MPETCIFCNIVEGKIPSVKVYEDGKHMAFLDINPRNPGHAIVIPKKHYGTIFEMPEPEAGEFFKAVRRVVLAVRGGVTAHGVSVAQSNGLAAGQRVPHVYFHVIPRFETEGPPGLEEMVPTKRSDPAALKAIGDKVKAAFNMDSEIEASVEKIFKESKKPEGFKPEAEREEKPKKKKDDIDFNF